VKPCGWSRGVAPQILELHTRWRCAVNLTPQLLYPQESFIAAYVCILLDGVFIHSIFIIMFKEQEKRNIPEIFS
jgi:hypothetical protein